MKAFVRVTYVGKEPMNLGQYGTITTGTKFSMGYKDIQFLEESRDGWPEYLEKGEESDIKEAKYIAQTEASEEALAAAKVHQDKLAADRKKEDAAAVEEKKKADVSAKFVADQAKRVEDEKAEREKAIEAERAVADEEAEDARKIAEKVAQKERITAGSAQAKKDGQEPAEDSDTEDTIDIPEPETDLPPEVEPTPAPDAGDGTAGGEGTPEDSEAVEAEHVPPYPEWTVDELRKELNTREVEFKSKDIKDDLIALLEADDETPDQ